MCGDIIVTIARVSGIGLLIECYNADHYISFILSKQCHKITHTEHHTRVLRFWRVPLVSEMWIN